MRQVLYGVILLALALSLVTIMANADSSLPATQPDHAIEWMPLTGIDHQIFPSEPISMAAASGRIPFLQVKLLNVPAGSKIHVTVKCESLIEDSSRDIVTSKDNPTLFLVIRPNWKFDRLAHIRQLIPVNLTYSVTINDQNLGERTDTALVHSINDCILEYRNDAGKLQPFRFFFAAYVNEDHPQIDKLLKDALATGIVKSFDGYQSKNPKQVYLQVFSIWDALQLKGIKYSNITDVPYNSPLVQSQHVRFLDESIDNAQANCADGSILFASVLQKIGIDSSLVITPSHMFVVFFAEPGLKQPITLETTLLGSINITNNSHHVLNLLDPRWRSKASAKTFEAAVEVDVEKYNNLLAAQKQQTAEHSDAFVGSIVNISAARKAGIMPIPYELTANPN